MNRFVFVFFALTACDQTWKAQGTIEDAHGDPIEGASVVVACGADAPPLDAVKTTVAGRFEVGGNISASRALGCSLEISKPGRHLRTVHMTDACFRSAKTNNYDSPCRVREGHIALP